MSSVQYSEVAVEDLRPNLFNPNKVSPDAELKIRESIRRNGFFRPVIVRETDSGLEIIGGQHRWEQARELGFTKVPVANLGRIDDKKAKEIGLLDNARYGADDTIMLSEILKEIGDPQELQSFLPYGDADIAAIFSASNITLENLDVMVDFDQPAPEVEDPTPALAKPVKTHTVMRFRLSNFDAERVTRLIAKTRKDQDFNNEDELTNVGDALVFLLSDKLISVAPAAAELDASDAELQQSFDLIASAQESAK